MYTLEVGTLTFTSDGTNITCTTQEGVAETVSLSSPEDVESVEDRVSVMFRGVRVVVSLNKDEWAYLKDGTALPQPEAVADAEATPVVAPTTRSGRRKA